MQINCQFSYKTEQNSLTDYRYSHITHFFLILITLNLSSAEYYQISEITTAFIYNVETFNSDLH